jgi:ZIP family zinc transporter
VDWSEVGWITASGLATSVGALGLLVLRHPSEQLLDGLGGFTGGVMLAATAFSLLVPALELGSVFEVVVGLAVGGLVFALLDDLMPHVHVRYFERGHSLSAEQVVQRHRGLLLLSALTIHNIPEGLAVGVAFAAGGPDLGIPIAVAIGIQNIPEGFAAGAPLLAAGGSRRLAAGIASGTGAVEPVAAALAIVAFGVVEGLLPAALAFAAGAMLYVVVDELVPESQARGNQRTATLSFIAGFCLMLVLDNAF